MTGKLNDSGEFINESARCPCVVILDSSSSMQGKPIRALNSAGRDFWLALREDELSRYSIELAVAKLGSPVVWIRQMDTIDRDDSQPWWGDLDARGLTPLGGAVSQALDLLEARKQEYKKNNIDYWQPWLVIMSDGKPNDDYKSVARRCRTLANGKKLVVVAVGIGERCDISQLAEFCSDDRPPRKLKGLAFSELFDWLAKSMSDQAHSMLGEKVPERDTGGWAVTDSDPVK